MSEAVENKEREEREERINQRRKRLDQTFKHAVKAVKNGEISAANLNHVDEEKDDVNKKQLDRVHESSVILSQRKFNAIQAVTDVRVVTDGLEAKRRENAENKLKERIAKLEEESKNSSDANMIVESKWREILELEIPQDLQNELKIQISKCHEIIKSKDDLIENFQSFLREKDEEYVRVLKKQTIDVSELMNRIGKSCLEMQAEYEAQSDIIKESYEAEREFVVKKHTDDIDNILNNRKEKEMFYTEERTKREIKYQKEIDDLIAKGTDEYNKLKVELESNIQTLNQQLEDIKATYQLNSEKLEYNFRVLTELASEKTNERDKCKRKATKIKDQLNVIIGKFHEMEKCYAKSSKELVEDYRNLTKKYKDLQAKFKHFELADTNKYRQVWLMHHDESRELINQLVICDQIITQRFLGLSWNPPDLKFIDNFEEEHSNVSNEVLLKTNQNISSSGEIKSISAHRLMSFFDTLISNANLTDSAQILSQTNLLKEMFATKPVSISIESLRNMFRILAVEHEAHIGQLISFYFNLSNDSDSTQDVTVSNEEINEIVMKYFEKLNESTVLSLLQELSNERTNFIYLDDFNEADISKDDNIVMDHEEKVKQQKLKDAAMYWTNVSNAISDDNVDVWRQLQKDYGNLNVVLDKRCKSLEAIKNLTMQNNELKATLNYCLGDNDFNGKFQISPVLTLKIPKTNFPNRNSEKFSQSLPPISTKAHTRKLEAKGKTKLVTYSNDELMLDNRSHSVNDMANLRKEFVDHIQKTKYK